MELLNNIRRYWVSFVVVVIASFAVAGYYLATRTKQYRVEARVAKLTPEQLYRASTSRRFDGPSLLRAFVDTASSAEFRREFFDKVIAPSSNAEPAFRTFNNHLMVRNMGDQYAIVNFLTPAPESAERWMTQFLSDVNLKTIDTLQKEQDRALEQASIQVKIRNDFFQQKREKSLERLVAEADAISKRTGVKMNRAMMDAFLKFDAMTLTSFQSQLESFEDQAYLSLQPQKLSLSEVVRVELAPTVSKHTVDFGAWFVLIYALVIGTILGILAVVIQSYLHAQWLSLRQRPLAHA